MHRTIAAFVFAFVPLVASAQTFNRARVYAEGGKSMTNWHGQAAMQLVNFEVSHAFSPRTEVGFVFAPVRMQQPRSWFGNVFGDGNEDVRAISGSLLFRRNFKLQSPQYNWYLEASSGPMWAEKRVPANTSRFNFISQAGAGFVLMPQSRFPLILGYRFAHISNGGYAPRNPGLNVSMLVIGTRIR